jgi:tetratricopeptide (TPR) repeat protein
MRFKSGYIIFLLVAALPCAHPVQAQRDKKKKPAEEAGPAQLREAEFYFTEGQKYFILEDYTKALFYFQRVAELNPKNATVHYKISEILTKSGKEEDMRKAADEIGLALSLEKKNKYFYLLAANIYGSLLQFSKAEETIETMMREVPGTEEYLFELAMFYNYDNKPDKAIEVYNRAEEIMGVNETSSFQKQKIYFDQGKIDQAVAEGQKLMDANPDDARYALALAEALSENKQTARAMAFLEEYIKVHPDVAAARLLLASFYRETGSEARARELLLVLFDDPSIESTSKILVLGTYVVQLSKEAEMSQASRPTRDAGLESFVLTLLAKLKSNHPEDPNVYIVGGDLNAALKKMVPAQMDYLKAIRKGSSSFEPWQNLMYLESQMNQFDSLIKHSDEGLELFPNQALLYYFNGYGHLRKRHYREAAGALEQARKLSTSNPALQGEINGMLGDAYNGARDYAKSDNAYEDALTQNPNNDLVLNNYSYYLALRKENLERAEKMAAQLIKSHPENASYLDTYAWVLFMREKYREARKVMERALATGDAGATHFEHYGDILFKLGETDEAVRQWQKAKSMDSDNEIIDKKIANRRLY